MRYILDLLVYKVKHQTIIMKQVLTALGWRYATKAYDTDKKVSDQDFEAILEAGRLAPTSFGLQPFRFVVVNDAATRAKLREIGWNQPQFTDASHLVVIATEKKLDDAYVDEFVALTAKTRGADVASLAGYAEMMKGALKGKGTPEARKAWAEKQAYIALGMMLLAAAEGKIDATPIEGFDPAAADKILGLDKLGLESSVIIALGYRSKSDGYAAQKKVRFSKEDMVVEIG